MQGKNAGLPRFFFDCEIMGAATDGGGFPYTPPMQLLAGLSHSLELLLDEGLDQVFSRHFKMAEGVRQATAAWGLDLCCQGSSIRLGYGDHNHGSRRIRR